MTKQECLPALAAIVAWWALTASAAADIVTLSDGSRLVGVVQRISDGRLILETQFAGTLEIDAAQIERIETDETVHVEMTTGDRLVGKIDWVDEVERPVVKTELGDIPFTVDKMASVWPEGGKSPEVLAMEQQIEQVRKQADAEKPRWALTLEAGSVFKEGNSDVREARGGVELKRTTPRDLLRLYAQGEFSEQNDKRSTAEAKIGAYYEHLLGERSFAFAGNELEYDEFEDIDLRVTLSLGGGYYLIKQELQELKARAGPGFLHESFRNGTESNTAILDVGLEYRADITPWMRFTHRATYYPTFEELRDYRLVFDTAFLFPIAGSKVWKLKLGAKQDYDPIPRTGLDSLDQTYYANIVLELK